MNLKRFLHTDAKNCKDATYVENDLATIPQSL